jgi:opacity protein-like surface antigen
MNKTLVIAASCLLATGIAQAQTGLQPKARWSGEIGYTSLRLEDGTSRFRPDSLRGIVGYEIGPNVAIEGMAAFGVRDDTATVLGASVDGRVSHSYGLYLKPKASLGSQLEVFGRVGVTRSRYSVAPGGLPATDSASDFSWGAGVNYSLSPTTYIGLDYLRLLDKGGIKANGVTLGLGMRF